MIKKTTLMTILLSDTTDHSSIAPTECETSSDTTHAGSIKNEPVTNVSGIVAVGSASHTGLDSTEEGNSSNSIAQMEYDIGQLHTSLVVTILENLPWSLSGTGQTQQIKQQSMQRASTTGSNVHDE